MIKKILFTLFIISLYSCNHSKESTLTTTWIGGKIINPKSDYVVISKDNCVLDTVRLNRQNFFMYSSDDLVEGLYSFQHFEYQIFYIKPGDSIILRVNTTDFDESLTYTGKGAERNNFLMEMFLMNENEAQLMPPMYRISPSEFQLKLDSLKKIRTNIYDEFVTKNHPDQNFKKIAEISIDYDFYTKKELYTSANITNLDFADSDAEKSNFYEYRKHIDFDIDPLRTYYPYYRFLNLYFDNIAFLKYNGSGYLQRNSFVHNYYKIQVIDSIVTNDSLRNSLIKTNTKLYLFGGKDEGKQREILRLFEETNNNPNDHVEIKELVEASMKLNPGNPIPNIPLLSTDNTVIGLRDIIRRPSVIYFWSSQSIKHYRQMHSRAAELKVLYPYYDFIGINVNSHFKKWLQIVNKSDYNKEFEYQLEDVTEAEKELVLYNINKAFIVNGRGQILEGNSNINHKQIESIIERFSYK